MFAAQRAGSALGRLAFEVFVLMMLCVPAVLILRLQSQMDEERIASEVSLVLLTLSDASPDSLLKHDRVILHWIENLGPVNDADSSLVSIICFNIGVARWKRAGSAAVMPPCVTDYMPAFERALPDETVPAIPTYYRGRPGRIRGERGRPGRSRGSRSRSRR